MNTELAFDRHKNVDLGLVFAFAARTALFIAGCCNTVEKTRKILSVMVNSRTKGMILSVLSISSLV